MTDLSGSSLAEVAAFLRRLEAARIHYSLTSGAFWLPVVWTQARMRDLARAAAEAGEPLPPAYHRLFRLWFWFGFPAFGAVMAIFWLMIARPGLSL